MDRAPFYKRSVAGFLVALCLFTSVSFVSFPQKARADLFGADAAALWQLVLKDFVLDGVARAATEAVRQAVLRSIINWANSGFEGSPAFVTNIERNLRGLADYVADSFIAELSASGVINSPFRDNMVRELSTAYRRMTSDQAFFETNRYTLDQYSTNPEAFFRGDFSQGGARAWIHAWLNPQNNPIGAFGAARRELETRILSATARRTDEISRNGGFLDFCRSTGTSESGEATTSLRPAVVGCRPGDTVVTAGTIVHGQLTRALGSDIDMLVSADELQEIFVAIANGVMRRTFSDSGFSGLSGSSGGSSNNNAPTMSADSVLSGVDTLTNSLTNYRTNWQRINTAINEAQAACNGSGNDAGQVAEVNNAATRALEALTDTQNLLNELGVIRAKLATGRSDDIREGTQSYQTLVASGRLPSVTDISFATRNSQDIDDAEPPTLFTRMSEIADGGCD